MNTCDFFKLLLPDTGWIFTATQLSGGKGWANTAHRTIDDAVAAVNHLTFEHKAAYYAMATYEKDRVWDAAYKDPRSGALGKWRTRTQANAQYLRSFFLDLDIDADDVLKFPSRDVAMQEFADFAKRVDLPQPMIVDSGGGYHLYWPLVHPVPTSEWRPVADAFKQICVKEGFRADRSLTSDQARVLRALGGYNTRRDRAVSLIQETSQVDFADFKRRIDAYALQYGLSMPPSRLPLGGDGSGNANDALGDNLGATNDPLNLDRIAFFCPQVGTQVGARGANAGEQLWRTALGIAKFCEPQELAYRAVSDGHPDYDEARTTQKMDYWRTGPTTCAHFHQENPGTCETCPHWGKLTSPAQLGRIVPSAAPTVIAISKVTAQPIQVTLPKPPKPYKLRDRAGAPDAVLIETEDRDGNMLHEIICPFAFYPKRSILQSGADSMLSARSVWIAKRVLAGAVVETEIEVPATVCTDTRRLHSFLAEKGVELTSSEAKHMPDYMSAYTRLLSEQVGREKAYDRLGWHENHSEFVLGNRVITGAAPRETIPLQSITTATRDGLHSKGSLDVWRQAMTFFEQPGYEGRRLVLGMAFGAPLLHIGDTGIKGALVAMNGPSGRGKTSMLKACASIWGHPTALVQSGTRDGATKNALMQALGTYHSLPFLLDETTEADPQEMRNFTLNVSQGQGKLRMKDGNSFVERTQSWETLVISTSNEDELMRLQATGKGTSSDPHMMRVVSIDFGLLDAGTAAKGRADAHLRMIAANYGHAGPEFINWVVANYAMVSDLFCRALAKIERRLASANAAAERYWTAAVAAAYTATRIALALHLLPPSWPVESDLDWAIEHLRRQRAFIDEHRQTPRELLAEFLEQNLMNTLLVSAKASSNLDNVVRAPTRDLLIRHDLDTNMAWISRAAIKAHCTEYRLDFRTLENSLVNDGVVTKRNAQRTLGSQTIYAKGQTRVWEVDMQTVTPSSDRAMPGSGSPAANDHTATPATVIPISGSTAA